LIFVDIHLLKKFAQIYHLGLVLKTYSNLYCKFALC